MYLFFEDLFVSSIASIFSKTTSAPIELWRLQRQNPFIPHSTLKDVVKKEGIRYLWKGNAINLIKGIPQYSINYALFRKIDNTINNKLISGIVSGSCSIGIIYPLETTRSYLSLQTNKNKYSGILDVLKKTPTKNLYKGFSMSLLGFGTFSGYLFYFQDKIKNKYPELSPISGGLASICALTISYPTDLLRRRLQLQSFDKTVPIYHNTSDMLKKIYKSERIRGFYRGLFPNYCKSFVQWSIHFYALQKLHSLTEKSKRSL
jgi:hypothetical protein